ncbi:MAG TPA: hypothetical protein VF478_10320, partial [Anaerolineae bacterium]
MNYMDSSKVRELLREVHYPGVSRDIVGAGFVGEIVAIGPMVEVEFKPTTLDHNKIDEMEHKIRDVLRDASFIDVQIRRVNPPIAEVPLRNVKDTTGDHSMGQHHDHHYDHDHDHDHKEGGCGCGSGASR